MSGWYRNDDFNSVYENHSWDIDNPRCSHKDCDWYCVGLTTVKIVDEQMKVCPCTMCTHFTKKAFYNEPEEKED